jgi:hypothetical protein
MAQLRQGHTIVRLIEGVTLLGRTIPNGWKQTPFGPRALGAVGWRYVCTATGSFRGLEVIESSGGPGMYGPDDKAEWLHTSCAYGNTLPSWEDLGMVKRIFVGPNMQSIMVFPPAREYVNIHPYVLHLYTRLDGDSCPHFAKPIGPGGPLSI